MKTMHPSTRLPSISSHTDCSQACCRARSLTKGRISGSSGRTRARALGAALLMAGVALAGCNKDKPAGEAKPGQSLASVNGEEITVLQLNEEMQRASVPAARQQVASKQLLQALIDRELLESEASKEKIDRDPKVMQAIERARSLIIAQAYMQKRVGDVGRPSQVEVEEYFNKHPQFFSKRRQFAMNQLVMPASAVTPELRAAADKAKSLDDVALFLDAKQIQYGRAQVTRSTADLKPEISSKLLSMPKGQLFFVQEGPRAMLIAIDEVREAPVSLAIAAPQITQYLTNLKNKELAQAEIQRLRATAKIEYLNKDLAPDPATPGVSPASGPGSTPAPGAASATLAGGPSHGPGTGSLGGAATAGSGIDSAAAAAAAPAAAAAGDSQPDKAALDRGVAGLK
jgi:EpsD family peptidyl-prolyl cis-trans isomerase